MYSLSEGNSISTRYTYVPMYVSTKCLPYLLLYIPVVDLYALVAKRSDMLTSYTRHEMKMKLLNLNGKQNNTNHQATSAPALTQR